MTRPTLRAKGDPRTAKAIRDLVPFRTAGALKGTVDPDGAGWLSGAELGRFHADRDSIDYAVVSYSTPIAWHTPNGWHVVATRFGAATGAHQSNLYLIGETR